MFRFRVWRTLEIGGMSLEGHFGALADKNIFVSVGAREVIEKIALPGTKMLVTMVKVTNTQLGLPSGLVECSAVYARALELGLQKCPAEVGPALRGLVRRQRKGKILLIGIDPITIPAYLGQFPVPPLDEFRIFSLERREMGLALYAPDARPKAKWVDSHCWVFAKEIRPM